MTYKKSVLSPKVGMSCRTAPISALVADLAKANEPIEALLDKHISRFHPKDQVRMLGHIIMCYKDCRSTFIRLGNQKVESILQSLRDAMTSAQKKEK